MPNEPLRVTCCVAGGGPAGMMVGLLLARAGIDTVVLEKHADFLRDFRGDTVHPSTLEIMAELGVLDEFLQRPHQKISVIHGLIGDDEIALGDFSRLNTTCKFMAMMPQWEFLDFLAKTGTRYPDFQVLMRHDVIDLIDDSGRIVGVRAETPEGTVDIYADLVIGADGRHSTVRDLAGFEVTDIGAPIDVLWMRLSKKPTDPDAILGRMNHGAILITLDRGDYWQCAYVIRKGGNDALRARGLDAFRQDIVRIAPFLADRVSELGDWDQVKLLTVAVNRLKRWWRPGLLCIGDAAHAMSPVGGVGINLAVQDAVAAANILAAPLLAGTLGTGDLDAVQRRRTLAMRVIQKMQVVIQERIIDRVLKSDKPVKAPAPMKLFNKYPRLRWIPARVVGLGVRPEHLRSPEAETPLAET
jgi:2-polyprenyl-6-methoxyphenol hydroxylase-like FAD-dependent oxidoreductase